MSKFQILAENEKKSRRRESRGGDERTVRVAALRAQRDEERRGNDAPWKAWKTQKAKTSFPPFPPGLEIRPKTAGFPHFHRAGGGFISLGEGLRMKPKTNFG
jgi:hypothetical protein